MANNPFDPGYFTEEHLLEYGFKRVGSNVRIAKTCTIIGLGNIELGNNVRIDGYCSIIAGESGFVRIGSHVHIAGYCGLYAAHGVVVGDFSGVSAGSKIFSSSDDYSGGTLTNPTVPSRFKNVTSGAVVLDRHVIVGSGSVILPGVTLHEGVAVGALSLVGKDLDPWSIYAGSPARRIRCRSKDLLALEQRLMLELGSSSSY